MHIGCWYFLLSFGLICLSNLSEGRIMKRCELAREMLRLGTSRSELATWCCIAQYESKFNTSAIGRLNGNWSNDFGLFQVSDRYWCQSKPSRSSSNLCQIDCQHLISEDIQEAVKCAHKVKQLQGWKAWAVYNGRCKNVKQLPSIDGCV